MVSRANVPRTMMSATPLTEAEEIELERIKDRIEASICKFKRELDADLDKIRRSLQDMCSTMETKDVSSGNCKSQLELPKFSDDRDFHKSSNVDRAIADEDLMEQHGSERYEEMDIELKMKIGVKDCTRVSTEMEDVEFLEEVTTPLQTKREMEIFMPMGKSTEVKKGKELEQNQLKQTECISHARQNVQVNELPMGLPISTHYSLPLSWLLNWFPRPTVKLKFVAQRDDELYGGFDDRSTVFVGYGECSIFDARGHSGIQMVNEYTSDQRSDTQHDELLVVFKNLPFKQNPHFRDVRGYNAAISGLMSCGRYNDAWTVYEMMEASNIRPDHVISSIMITVMRKNGDSAEDAWKFFEKMNQKGIDWSLEAVGALIKLFCDEGLKKEALIIQSELEKKGISSNAVIYNTIMDAYGKSNHVEEAEGLFTEMKAKGVAPTAATYNILMDAYSRRMQPDIVEKLLEEMEAAGLEPNVRSYTCLISAYGRQKKMSDMAADAFLRMKRIGIKPSSHSYTALIHAYSISGWHEKAYLAFDDMLRERIKPSIETYTALLDAFRRAGDTETLMKIWKLMIRDKVEGTRVTFNILVDGFAKQGQYVEARDVMHEFGKHGFHPTVMTYNMLMNAYARGGQESKLPQLLKEMAALNLKPDSVTYSTIIYAYVRVRDFSRAFFYHKQMVKNRQVPDAKSYEKLRAILNVKAKVKNRKDKSALMGIIKASAGLLKEKKKGKKDEFWKTKKGLRTPQSRPPQPSR